MLFRERRDDRLRHFRGGGSVRRVIKVQEQNAHGMIVQGKRKAMKFGPCSRGQVPRENAWLQVTAPPTRMCYP